MPRRVSLEERREIITNSQVLSQREIARKINRPQKTVNRILQAFYGDNRLEDAPHQRRPRKTTQVEDALIIAAAVKDPFTTAAKIRGIRDVHQRFCHQAPS
ncbi:hypothetical protein HPB48_012977 [Haemaphysalis longicornis]|uniref:Transposase IS30-like HTH domain-containing protein n=1 Tax=Haemaphysalis longicornis TaxID=44386 RepID=A0A9J6GBU1_HAELO|nr:hypothetical protein HPB48_012977 [Haemaphysalis longicornis]